MNVWLPFDVKRSTEPKEFVPSVNATGYVYVSDVPPEKVMYPPWVQDGNGADPDERSGSFTENLQIGNHRHDAVRRKFQQN